MSESHTESDTMFDSDAMFDAAAFLRRREVAPLKGALAGLLGGLVASWVMNRFQAAVPAATFKKLLGEAGGERGGAGERGSREEQQAEAEPATVKAAEAVSEGALGHELEQDEKRWAGPAVHYAFGASAGAVYGALSEAAPRLTVGAGLPFGAAFWLVADEGAVPALGLSKAPWRYPLSTHAYAFVSHLVYGVTAEAVRRLIRSRL